MTVKAMRNRLDRISQKVGQDRGELINVRLIDTFDHETGQPDRIINIKMFSRSGEMYTDADNIINRSEMDHAPVDDLNYQDYSERSNISSLYHSDD